MKILLAVDGSSYTQRMLDYVAAHKDMFGPGHDYAAVTVVPQVPPHVTHFIDRRTLSQYYGDEAAKVLGPVQAFAKQQGWRLEALQPVGHAGELIAKTAEAGQFDLVLMGSHGHSSLGNLLLGSVATRVLASCKVPTLIIR